MNQTTERHGDTNFHDTAHTSANRCFCFCLSQFMQVFSLLMPAILMSLFLYINIYYKLCKIFFFSFFFFTLGMKVLPYY